MVAGTPIALKASGEDSSTTRSGISGGVITITDETRQQHLTGETADEAIAGINRDVSSDKDGSNTLRPIFDREEVEAGFEITEQFVRNVGTFLEQRSLASTEAKKALEAELTKPADQQDAERITQLVGDIERNTTWEIGGLGRTLISAISGAAGGNVMGGGSQLLQGAAVSYLQGLAAEQVKGIADELESESARTALHAIVGCAGAAAHSQSCGAGALGGSVSVVLNNLLDQLSDQTAAGMTDEQKQNRLNLIGTLVAGITAAAGGEAAVAANAAQITAGNNDLSLPPGLMNYGQAATSLSQYMQEHGASAEEIAEAQRALARGDGFDGPDPVHEFLVAWATTVFPGLAAEAVALKIGVMLARMGVGGSARVVAQETKGAGAASDIPKGVTNPEIPKLDRPLILEGMTQSQFGKDVIGWGARPEGALQRIETISSSEIASMQQKGLTREMVTQWKNFYSNEFSRNSNNLTARNRVELMQKILDNWN